MPRMGAVSAHDRTKGLKPERIGEAAQQLSAAVVMHDCLRNHSTKSCHARRAPRSDSAAMQRKIGTTSSLRHGEMIADFASVLRP
jgi:hypothetical protein